MAAAREPRAQDRRAHPDDEQPRDEVEPRIELLGEHVLRQRQRHDPERRDARGVRDGDRRAEGDRVPRRPASADEVGGDHRLAVAGGQGVHGAPAESGEQQQEEHALARRRVGEQSGEPVRRAPAPAARPRSRGGERAVARAHVEARRAQVGWALEQRLRVARQPPRRVGRGRIRADRGAASRAGDDRAPADAVAERVVAQRHAARTARRSAQRELEARRPQPAGAGARRQRRRSDRPQRRRPAVDGDAQAARDLGADAPQQLGPWHAALLERRDLGLVEEVAHVHAVGRDRHLREVVDREVPERVGLRGGRRARERAERAGEREQPSRARVPESRPHRPLPSSRRASRACHGRVASPWASAKRSRRRLPRRSPVALAATAAW